MSSRTAPAARSTSRHHVVFGQTSSGSGALLVTQGEALLDGNLTTLDGLSVTLNGAGALRHQPVEPSVQRQLEHRRRQLRDLDLVDIDHSSVVVSSGTTLSLPLVASYSNPSGGNQTFEATGTAVC